MVSPKVHRSNGRGQKMSTAAAKNSLEKKVGTKEIALRLTVMQEKGKAEGDFHVERLTSTRNPPLTLPHATDERSSASTILRSIDEELVNAKKKKARSLSALLYSRWTETKDDQSIDDRAKISDDALQRRAWKPRRVISIEITGIPCPEGCSEKER